MTPTDSPSLLIKQLLLDNSLGVEPSSDAPTWPIYLTHEPDGDEVEDNVITIYDTSGRTDGRLMAGSVIQHYGLQIRVRSHTNAAGWERMSLIFSLFEDILRESVTVGTTNYIIQNISITSPILPLGIPEDDTKRRDLFTLNVLLTIKE